MRREHDYHDNDDDGDDRGDGDGDGDCDDNNADDDVGGVLDGVGSGGDSSEVTTSTCLSADEPTSITVKLHIMSVSSVGEALGHHHQRAEATEREPCV